MNRTHVNRWCIGLLGVIASIRLAAAPQLIGVLTVSENTFVAIGDNQTGREQWLRPGQEFERYVVIAYDATASAVIAAKDGVRVVLPLRGRQAARTAGTRALITIAEREAQTRDGWDGWIWCGNPEPYGDDYKILIRRTAPGSSEARLIILSREGTIKGYWKV